MTLYRKYRPQTFADVVAQDHVKTTLRNAVSRDLVSHAYLFTGPRGTGKTSMARILAKVLNCQNRTEDNNPCNECENCRQINDGNLIDIVEIDAASNRGIDEIRELKQTLQFRPSFIDNKIYIIDEVHMLTKEAFNALLKTLEEPPDYVYFVLATTEVEKIPDTIISRCQRFDFRRIHDAAISERLAFICEQEKIKAAPEALQLIAHESDGGMRDAISLLEQLNSLYEELEADQIANFLGRTEHQLCQDYIDYVFAGDLNGALTAVERFNSEGYNMEQVYKDLLRLLRKCFLDAVANNESPAACLRFVETLEKNYVLFHKSAIPQLVFEVTAAALVGTPQAQPAQVVKPEPKKAKAASAPVAEKPVVATVEREHRPVKTEQPAPTPVPAPEPKVIEEEVETEVKEEQAPVAAGDLSFKDLKRRWHKVVDKVASPRLRISLKQGHIDDYDGQEIKMSFASAFHLKQVNHPPEIAEIEKAIVEVFGQKVYVKIASNLNGKQAVAEKAAADGGDFVESAMEMFADL